MGKKILLVDDDYNVLKTITMILENTGYEVDSASVGFMGLE